jgi:hypothetical protein
MDKINLLKHRLNVRVLFNTVPPKEYVKVEGKVVAAHEGIQEDKRYRKIGGTAPLTLNLGTI